MYVLSLHDYVDNNINCVEMGKTETSLYLQANAG